MTKGAARAAAGAIALVAWLGLAVQFTAVYLNLGSVVATLIALLAYFTIITNLVAAILFTGIAAGWPGFDAPWSVAGTALSIALVGVVYALLLQKLYHLVGAEAFSNLLMHRMMPILVPLYWLVWTPKGRLRFIDPLLWGVYPIGYLVYALARGAATGFYPYPFMDVSRLGWGGTAINVALIAMGFLAVGWGLTLLDRRLARPRTESAQAGSSS